MYTFSITFNCWQHSQLLVDDGNARACESVGRMKIHFLAFEDHLAMIALVRSLPEH